MSYRAIKITLLIKGIQALCYFELIIVFKLKKVY